MMGPGQGREGKAVLGLPAPDTTLEAPEEYVRRPTRLGFLVLFLFFVVLGGWSYTAPLAGGAVATGVVSPEGSVRTVQHLEGGIIATFFVQEGDRVEAGEPLVALVDVKPKADVDALLDRQRARLAEAARHQAEAEGLPSLSMPEAVANDPQGAAAWEAEIAIFRARSAMHDARKQLLDRRIEQLQEQIAGFEAQAESARLQLDLLEQEIDSKAQLVERGVAPEVELMRLKRDHAELTGVEGEYRAAIARARQQISETEIEVLALDAERTQQAALRAAEVRSELAEIEQALAARQDALARTIVTAPVAGIVSHMRTRSVGAVLNPGQPILDIVPSGEGLIIEARIAPKDIDIVQPGLPALVHFAAFSARNSPRFTGKVVSVSADRIEDPYSRQAYYPARIEIDRSALDAASIELIVGMSAEVFIAARERTAFDYIMQPFMDAVRRAGREI